MTEPHDEQPVSFEHLLKTKHGNELARLGPVRAIVQEWVKSSPLIYLVGPSSSGKTSLGGTLMHHPDYRPVLLIGIESGDGTIDEWSHHETACIRRVFEGEPKDQRVWIYEQLDAAADTECSAILIEGLATWHKLAVARALRSAPRVSGRALQQLYIEPSGHTAAAIGGIYDLKLKRKARGRPCPIIVTANTKVVGPDGEQTIMPGFSANLTQQAMQTADAFVEVRLSRTGQSLLTREDSSKHKLRHPQAAEVIERQVNLTLPGMLALWALTIHVNRAALAKRLTSY